MKPAPLPEANVTMKAPEGMDSCMDLPTCHTHVDNKRVVISAWQPSEDERKIIAAGGRIYLFIYGKGMPPVSLSAGVDLDHATQQG